MNKENDATFWSPTGWITDQPYPEPYKVMTAKEPEERCDERKIVGYELTPRHLPYEEYGMSADIYRHSDGHLFIEFLGDSATDLDQEPCFRFFVTRSNAQVFLATWYVDFVQKMAAFRQTKALEKLEKAFLAFIRHGHGRHTINQYGWQSLDDVEQANE